MASWEHILYKGIARHERVKWGQGKDMKTLKKCIVHFIKKTLSIWIFLKFKSATRFAVFKKVNLKSLMKKGRMTSITNQIVDVNFFKET